MLWEEADILVKYYKNIVFLSFNDGAYAVLGYCEIIIFLGGLIFVVFMDSINNEFTSPTNNDV